MRTIVLIACLMSLTSEARPKPKAPEPRPICCTITVGSKMVKKELSCGENWRPQDCCQMMKPVLFGEKRILADANEGSCKAVSLDKFMSDVEVCSRPTNFADTSMLAGPLIDAATAAVGFPHAWIRTPRSEAGQDLKKGFSRVIFWTEWKDVWGLGNEEGSSCHQVAQCDVKCVEEKIVVGKPLGVYGAALNNCHDAVVRVLSRCGCKNTCLQYADENEKICIAWSWPKLGHEDHLGICPFH